MKPRIFLDTNVFIYGFEFPDSNSNKVIQLLNQNEVEGVISEKVIEEVMRYFKKHYDKDLAAKFRLYLLQSCNVVRKSQVENEMDRWKSEIKDKDLEQLVVVKKLGIKYLISYDRDFDDFEEYFTPREFLEAIDKDSAGTQY